jgi:hypothetical protein
MGKGNILKCQNLLASGARQGCWRISEMLCCAIGSHIIVDLYLQSSATLETLRLSVLLVDFTRASPTVGTVKIVSVWLPMWCDKCGQESGYSYTRLTLVGQGCCQAGLAGILHHVRAVHAMCTLPSCDHGRGATSAYPCSSGDFFQVALHKPCLSVH